jgi:hypothetical protein
MSCPESLNPLQLSHGALVDDVASIQRGSRLKQHNPAFLLRDRTVLHAPRHDDELALFDPLLAVEEFHPKAAFDHQEHLIFVLMVMKHELALDLYQFYLLPVEFPRDVRFVVFRNLGEFVSDVDLVHDAPSGNDVPIQIRPEPNRSQTKAASSR